MAIKRETLWKIVEENGYSAPLEVVVAATSAMYEEFPLLGEIRSRGVAARLRVLDELEKVAETRELDTKFGEGYSNSYELLWELFGNRRRLGVYVHNSLDPESSIGIGWAGPIFYLHDNIYKLVTPEEVTDIRRDALAFDPSEELWALYLQGKDARIEDVIKNASDRFPLEIKE